MATAITFDELRETCLGCNLCPLAETRHHVVFGVGDPAADVMFIGEGPGENEDLQGEPFVGRAGQLLDKMLAAIDLSRTSGGIYITNIVKCRPPGNRDPKPEEQEACIAYLRDQVRFINPKLVVCLGRIAAQRLMDPGFKVTRQHGQWVRKGDLLMMGTFHPAALLRNPRQKPDAMADFFSLREQIAALKR